MSGVQFADLSVGDELPPLELTLTATLIAAGAIATRDFMPVHHDRDYAGTQGAPDIFPNILSDTAYCSRFLTDWGGPQTMVKRLAIRLGVPVFPGDTLTYTGAVTGLAIEAGEGLAVVGFQARGVLGDHVSGSATVSFPLDT